jgi:MFS family permease
MKKKIFLIFTATIGAFIGWLITEPWSDSFGFTRNLIIGIVVGLFIVLSIISFNYIYFKKFNLLKQNLKYPLVYIFPIIGFFLASILYSVLQGGVVGRLLSWALWGLFLGLAINIYDRKKDKILVGIIGGIVGGTLGALLFELISNALNINGGVVARALGFVLFAIILAISLIWVESLYKKLSGSNTNKFDFDDLKINKKK